MVEHVGLQSNSWVQILTLPLTSCLTLDKLTLFLQGHISSPAKIGLILYFLRSRMLTLLFIQLMKKNDCQSNYDTTLIVKFTYFRDVKMFFNKRILQLRK